MAAPSRRAARRAPLLALVIGHALWTVQIPGPTAARAEAPAPAPRLIAIHPTSHILPANHLKFYLHFSEPMRQGVFLEHCRLLDDQNRPVTEPFRETELWNEAGTRLTLWFHPGRQKTGVNLNVELGPIVEPRRRYKLVISGKWPSASGVPLGRDVEKAFITSDPATAQLDIRSWKITPPAAGTRQPLEVRFPAPLDHALLERCLRVTDDTGAPVEGRIAISDAGMLWRLAPARPWVPGSWRLEADSILEDLAGNSLARPFEVDLTAAPPRKTPPVVRTTFSIATPK